jgi:hypothetical protein
LTRLLLARQPLTTLTAHIALKPDDKLMQKQPLNTL